MSGAKAAMRVQEITIGNERAVVVPQQTWRRLVSRLGELEDERVYDWAKADPDTKTIEHDELCRLLGESPLRYLRSQADMTQAQLARRTGLSQSFIAKVEAGEKRLSDATRKKIARVLTIDPSRL